MLILPDGRRIGSISGGCLEGDVSRKAWWFTEKGRPSVRVYDTTSNEDAVWEFGLGCNGVIEVMLERVETDATCEALEFLDSCRRSRKPAVMAVAIRAGDSAGVMTGDRLFANECGLLGGALRRRWVELQPHAEQALREKKSRLVCLPGCEVFVEYVGVAPPLVVFGAGHDAIPVVSMAKQLGWQVTVADGRPAYATQARFPQADRVVVMQPGRLLEGIEITHDSVVVMMTHNYEQDKQLLRQILPASPRYLGLLGPAKRAENLFRELGISRGPVDVHAPVGLDIGGDLARSDRAFDRGGNPGRTFGAEWNETPPSTRPDPRAGPRSGR